MHNRVHYGGGGATSHQQLTNTLHHHAIPTGPQATRLLDLYQGCIEKGFWAHLVFSTRFGKVRLQSSCCPTSITVAATIPSCMHATRPGNARKCGHNRRRYETARLLLTWQNINNNDKGHDHNCSSSNSSSRDPLTPPPLNSSLFSSCSSMSYSPYNSNSANSCNLSENIV